METDHEHEEETIDPIPNPDVPGCYAAMAILIMAVAASGAALLLTARWILRVAGN